MTISTAAPAAEGACAPAENDNASAKASNKSVLSGEIEAKKVLQGWKTSFIGDAAAASFNIGLLVSGSLLALHRANSLVAARFEQNKCESAHWDMVLEALYRGRDTPIDRVGLLERINGKDTKTKDRFQITWFDDVDQAPAKEELLEGVLGVGEFTVLVAKPGGGKSVLAADIGCHIAADKEWHGRKVKPGLVVFFAAERKRLTERRVAAWRKYHGVESIPFVVVGGKLDLTTGLTDAKSLIETVQTLELDSDEQCVLIILDTVTRTFGPADQHQSKDMGRYIQSVDEIARAIGAHILAVHHSPWSDDRGKGAIDLDGAVDASFVIKPAGKMFSFECTGSNDGAEEKIMAFSLKSVPLGTDANGNETTAPVVVATDGKLAGLYDDSSTDKMSKANRLALDTLKKAIELHGKPVPEGTSGFPDNCVFVTRKDWQAEYDGSTTGKNQESKERSLRRARTALLEAHEIRVSGECCWIPDKRTKPDLSGQT